ncbi:hypothetical protein ACEU6E_10805 (plasmid) [Halorutilales archaeon Cl-col2-1]
MNRKALTVGLTFLALFALVGGSFLLETVTSNDEAEGEIPNAERVRVLEVNETTDIFRVMHRNGAVDEAQFVDGGISEILEDSDVRIYLLNERNEDGRLQVFHLDAIEMNASNPDRW